MYLSLIVSNETESKTENSMREDKYDESLKLYTQANRQRHT